ncbi:major facilitator superfamily domain-containing protein [Cantharellus anzutake]|uniref:major facilitator superfamily domain-containing protein n=1 Tax=Cantharellus anzutake TaxID=1750568 RepID=UPI0019057CB7|nr:major facilitator superfamily domain-containing protein [Cantharellus anzutake]KAF8329701.1 major facilitator superfamily domain-containing protein [Cantharellus anzutake]
MLSVFLFALDQLIIATAIPKITNQFHSLTQISWLANGFFLTMLSFNLIYAQLLTIFPSKHMILFAIAVFELGSLVCGAAPNMVVLILGRSIAGMGGAGVFVSCVIVLTEITTLKQRAMYMSLIGICFAVASVLGPLVGGAFSDHVSWRWCFYINLPIGGIAFCLLFILLETRHPYGRAETYRGYGYHMVNQIARCDWMGVAITLCWGVVFILGPQWGGVTKPWNDGNVIACFVMSVVLVVVFVAWEAYMADHAMLPLKLFKYPTLRGASLVSFFEWGAFMIAVYYLSVGFQAAYNVSATAAGIRLLPMIIVQVFTLILTGRLIAHFGRPYLIILLGPVFIALGCGLLYSVTPADHISKLMGYEVFVGIGVGMFLQNTIMITQYEFRDQPQLMSAATGVVVFVGFTGRLFGISVAGSVFENMIQVNIHKYAPNLPRPLVIAVMNAADAVWKVVPPPDRPAVLHAYVDTLNDVFLIGVPAGVLGFFVALFMPVLKMDFSQYGGNSKNGDVEKIAGAAVPSPSEAEARTSGPATEGGHTSDKKELEPEEDVKV